MHKDAAKCRRHCFVEVWFLTTIGQCLFCLKGNINESGVSTELFPPSRLIGLPVLGSKRVFADSLLYVQNAIVVFSVASAPKQSISIFTDYD